MTWFDAAALAVVVLAAWVGSLRGFGRALIDFVGGIFILKLALTLSKPLAQAVHITAAAGSNRAVCFAATFVGLAVVVLVVSRLIYSSTLLSLEFVDPIVGGFLGACTGLILAFVLLHSLQLSYGSSEAGTRLVGSLAGQELLRLRTYHTVLEGLTNLGKT